MGFYRFMPSRYMDGMLDGNFRFGSLKYYRLMESVFDDDWIGDSEDGKFITEIERVEVIGGQPDSEVRQKLKMLKIVDGDGDGDVLIEGVRLISEVNGYVLCFSVGDRSELEEDMLKDGYDSCLSFPDLECLANVIYYEGVDANNRPASEIFNFPLFGVVSYTSNTASFESVGEHNGWGGASPFVKRVKYKKQREYRIFLESKLGMDEDFVVLKVEDIGVLCKQEFRGSEKSESVVAKIGPLELYIESLRSVCGEVEAKRNEVFDSTRHLRDSKQYIEALNRSDEVEVFQRDYFKLALKSYWVLRNEYKMKCPRLDSFFSLTSFDGGDIAHFLYLMGLYFDMFDSGKQGRLGG